MHLIPIAALTSVVKLIVSLSTPEEVEKRTGIQYLRAKLKL